MISNMRDQIAVMDTNIKLLQAKVNAEVFSGLIKGAPATSAMHTRAHPMPPAPAASPAITLPEEPAAEQLIPTQYKATMVQGKVLSEDGKPMHGIAIKIMNSDKKVIKETTTNRAGIWMAQLRPGKYISKAILDNKPAQFKLFDVVEGQASQDV